MSDQPTLIIVRCYACGCLVRQDFALPAIVISPPHELDNMLTGLKQVIDHAQEPDETMRRVKGMFENATSPERRVEVKLCQDCHKLISTAKEGTRGYMMPGTIIGAPIGGDK
jgi:hypothetical protein